ncbi:MAG TPA: YceI family protein [Polyangiaceae bacterium]|nr:YceI family protein [Polyangiaceae bacterium]
MKTSHVLAALAPLVLVLACHDPSKDQAAATVGSALPVASATSPGASTQLAITPATSKIEWTGSKVTGSHDGSFSSFDGTIDWVDANPEKSKVTVEIDAATLTTAPEKLVGHLKSPDFFDVVKFPKAQFVSTSVKAGGDKGATHTITGNLTLHGVTKSIAFPATLKGTAHSVDADATFTLDRKDFGLDYPGKADDLIRDGVVIRLKIHAEKKNAT